MMHLSDTSMSKLMWQTVKQFGGVPQDIVEGALDVPHEANIYVFAPDGLCNISRSALVADACHILNQRARYRLSGLIGITHDDRSISISRVLCSCPEAQP